MSRLSLSARIPSMRENIKQHDDRKRVIDPKILYFGTPVVLLSTLNEDETTNITPLSSAWALGNRIVLGLEEGGKGLSNLYHSKGCVVNVPDPSSWRKVEKLAPLTGANPVPDYPDYKQKLYRFEKDKFSAAGLTPVSSEAVQPMRIVECPLQIEANTVTIFAAGGTLRFSIVEVEALKIHADERIIEGDHHIDPHTWSPLIYNFRHYYGLGQELGETFRAKTG